MSANSMAVGLQDLEKTTENNERARYVTSEVPGTRSGRHCVNTRKEEHLKIRNTPLPMPCCFSYDTKT
jgi:hypothetical protein